MFRKRSLQERFWEIIPGLQFWTVLFGSIALSYFRPVWAAVFIICFDLYWVLKAINVSSHLIASYRIFKVFVKWDWLALANKTADLKSLSEYLTALKAISKTDRQLKKQESARVLKLANKNFTPKPFNFVWHAVLLPFVDETIDVLQSSVSSIINSKYPKDRMILILAREERTGQDSEILADKIKDQYREHFAEIFITSHPDNLPNEIKGKSSNAAYSIISLLPEFKKMGIGFNQILISNFDSDTIVHPQYFARVTYEFLLNENPYRASYQPIAVYNNNIWDTPAIIRVVSVSNSFWQFTESSRPHRLRTFSSHTMPLQTLIEVGFWKKDIVNEDGFIYWQCYLKFKGDYNVIPLFVPVSLDTCLASTTMQTLINQYKQKRRWAYNVEYWPHLVPKLITLKAPFWDRMYKLYQYWEQNFNWATASIIISTLGWLPLYIGTSGFQDSVTAFNLPKLTRFLMNLAMVFLIFSVYINMVLLPPRPTRYGKWKTIAMYLQWFLVPFVSIIFGSLPAIEAQTRLMLGKYLEFWVTPKARFGENTGLSMKEMKQ